MFKESVSFYSKPPNFVDGVGPGEKWKSNDDVHTLKTQISDDIENGKTELTDVIEKRNTAYEKLKHKNYELVKEI